jgi:MFS family permease
MPRGVPWRRSRTHWTPAVADDTMRPGVFSHLHLGRSTWILTACQALYYAGVSVDLTLTAIVGLMLAPAPELATIPLATISVTGTLCSVGAGVLSARIGYPRVMILGAMLAIVGGVLSALAIQADSFWLLCLGTGFVGAYRSTGGYIRYMAADLAPAGHRDEALSFILYGGLIAAFAGPFAATASAHVIEPEYTAAYLLVALFSLCSIVLIAFLPAKASRSEAVKDVSGGGEDADSSPRPIASVIHSADFRLGLIALAGAAALMTMVMAMGPLASHEAGHSMSDGAFMIQWHMVGMFAPAIISGHVMTRIGPHHTGVIGATILGVGAAFGILGTDVWILVLSLALNGIGWNFLFLAGTSLVVRTYPAGRGGRIQSVAEGVASVSGVAASLSASTLFVWLGWRGTNGPVLLCAIALLLSIAIVGRGRAQGLANTRDQAAGAGRDSVTGGSETSTA